MGVGLVLVGPSVQHCGMLSVFSYNARSILPKVENLAVVLVHEPDIVCIVESWLDGDVDQ